MEGKLHGTYQILSSPAKQISKAMPYGLIRRQVTTGTEKATMTTSTIMTGMEMDSQKYATKK